MHLVDGGAHPQGERRHRGHRHHNDDDGVPCGFQENGVLEQPDVVVQEHKMGAGIDVVEIGVSKAGNNAHGHGRQNKSNEEKQCGEQE